MLTHSPAQGACVRTRRHLCEELRPRTAVTHAHSAVSHLLCPCRFVVQSNSGHGLRSPLDQYTDMELARKLSRNGRGNYYRYQQKLWPSRERLECELSSALYSSAERSPLALLPTRRPPAPTLTATCEGNGVRALMQRAQAELAAGDVHGAAAGVALPIAADGADLTPISEKMIADGDLHGSILASASERARDVILGDLAHNELMPCRPALSPAAVAAEAALTGARAPLPSARDAANTPWYALGLDPLLSDVAARHYGPRPSRLQGRLLPALLDEDHNDVLFNGVTGSGKTASLVLAALQGIRAESAGMNVLVAANSMNAMRLHDAVHALCRHGDRDGVPLGGTLVDRPRDDFSWLKLGTFREDYYKYYAQLRASLRAPHGPTRLFITTADVFCQLLFEKKMEFEDFGYLRRVYVDDVGAQVPMVPDDAPVNVMRERLRNPRAAELLLGTLHQLPGPHVRSLLQLGLVSADVDGALKNHLQSLCVKPAAHTIVLSAVRLPSTLHCLFHFFLPSADRWKSLASLIWTARASIPGRAVIFVPDTADVLTVRRQLRGHGMNAKLFSEVYGAGAFKDRWKFLLLKESEAFGLDIPLVSHVFIAFAPTSWQSYQHMCGRAGRLGNVGWVYVVTDKREAAHVRGVAEDLHVDFVNHVLDAGLQPVASDEVDRLTRKPTLYGLDPQYAVNQHYEVQSESPDAAYRRREFFTRPNANKQFQMENYTPIPVQQRRFDNARRLAHDVDKNPAMVTKMVREGWLDGTLKPTGKLRRELAHTVSGVPSSSSSPSRRSR